jgi:hypothetical protein
MAGMCYGQNCQIQHARMCHGQIQHGQNVFLSKTSDTACLGTVHSNSLKFPAMKRKQIKNCEDPFFKLDREGEEEQW